MKIANAYPIRITQANNPNETAINEALEGSLSGTESRFVKYHKDNDGILRIRTFFKHDDISENDLWEIFVPGTKHLLWNF